MDGLVGDEGAAGEVEALGEGAELGKRSEKRGIVQGRTEWPKVEDAVAGDGFEVAFDVRFPQVDGPRKVNGSARASDPADQRDGGGGRWACGGEKRSECGLSIELELRSHRLISSQVVVSAVRVQLQSFSGPTRATTYP